MSTTPLKLDIFEDDDRRHHHHHHHDRDRGAGNGREWETRKSSSSYKGPLRLLRLCVLGAFLPAALVACPVYLRYRVYSEQLYPLAASDQRLIDRRVSTTWCQRQVVRVNATFNAYLLKGSPKIEREKKSISMRRHLVLEDDMKEYWGFYLLKGSSVTVSSCVRWPGASLTIIRGHKHLHECAFIGDDSSEEIEELVQVALERGLLLTNSTEEPRLTENRFNVPGSPATQRKMWGGQSNAPERMKMAREEIRFHEQPSRNADENEAAEAAATATAGASRINYEDSDDSHELDPVVMRQILTSLFLKTFETKKKQKENRHHRYEGFFKDSSNIERPPSAYSGIIRGVEGATRKPSSAPLQTASAEMFTEVLKKLNSLGEGGKRVLERLVDEMSVQRNDEDAEARQLREILDEVMTNGTRRSMRRSILGSSMYDSLVEDAEPSEDAAVENQEEEEEEEEEERVPEELLYPDGIAQDRGTVNETNLDDRSNSEFWSSFSSSEERLLECKGLILNLPLTPHLRCSPKYPNEHATASAVNTVTYRVPIDGYYFFVFNSENEIQPNYIGIQFDIVKTMYDTSEPVEACTNSTTECALPLNFFSRERTVLELPVNGNESQWNEEYVVISTCEPRTSVYLICIIAVPMLILLFAFH